MISDPLGDETRLWHKMRADLEHIAPGSTDGGRLMCCLCGRFLERQHFNLEHIIPEQALKDDPSPVKAVSFKSARNKHTLLCKRALKVGSRTFENGCNGWKGRNYDTSIRRLLNRSVFTASRRTLQERISVAAFILGFLAMFSEWGYQIALTPAGVLTRRQFFSPDRFLKAIPAMGQLLLVGGAPEEVEDNTLGYWNEPFHFKVEESSCSVNVRNYVVNLPLSRDPRIPLAQHLSFVPSRFTMRADFTVLVG